MGMLWGYAAGAVVMALLGPSPWWLSAEYVEEEAHGELPLWKGAGLWVGWVAAWPLVLWWLARRGARHVYNRLL